LCHLAIVDQTVSGAQCMSQIQLFSVYVVDVKPDNGRPIVPAFFVESTAPDNIDDKDGALATPNGCKPSEIDDIVGMLGQQQNPKLLITVHGFNTPREKVLETYRKSFEASKTNRAGREEQRLKLMNARFVPTLRVWTQENTGA
jgi:hypothetical protein